jgi:hypothetical protein
MDAAPVWPYGSTGESSRACAYSLLSGNANGLDCGRDIERRADDSLGSESVIRTTTGLRGWGRNLIPRRAAGGKRPFRMSTYSLALPRYRKEAAHTRYSAPCRSSNQPGWAGLLLARVVVAPAGPCQPPIGTIIPDREDYVKMYSLIFSAQVHSRRLCYC